MIDYELMRDQLEERRRRAEHRARVRRTLAESGAPRRSWPEAVRSMTGLRVARMGLWLAGVHR